MLLNLVHCLGGGWGDEWMDEFGWKDDVAYNMDEWMIWGHKHGKVDN
jgi:hypothetical protein